MRVISAKQNYNELVAHHSWDEETQIKYFLEYAEEYQLTAHFLAYLALKPVTTVKTLASTDISSAEDEVTDRYRFGARG